MYKTTWRNYSKSLKIQLKRYRRNWKGNWIIQKLNCRNLSITCTREWPRIFKSYTQLIYMRERRIRPNSGEYHCHYKSTYKQLATIKSNSNPKTSSPQWYKSCLSFQNDLSINLQGNLKILVQYKSMTQCYHKFRSLSRST
jgi:hypothetical protein